MGKLPTISEDESTSLAWAHPLVRDWFLSRFGTPTEPQISGWPHILAGHTTLISAPTGSGKTLAAFLACIDRLVRKALAGELRDCTEVLYISPLKALGNDIQKNLEIPLGEIQALAGERGLLMPTIRTAVRTGDTLAKERRTMLKTPPHILVTTPESLYILLTAGKSREILRHVNTVIVDEIHAIADDKRGTHLALSLARLDHLVLDYHRQCAEARGESFAVEFENSTIRQSENQSSINNQQSAISSHSSFVPRTSSLLPVRIGLSATQRPIELVANFLAGAGEKSPVHIVNIGSHRALDLAIETPSSELGPIATNEMWDEIYERIVALSAQHRSTLIFVNTRRLAERASHRLAERLGEDKVAAHHGSLSRKLRLDAENRLKTGQVSVLVATASLELGIDIGFVDLVIQIGSTRSIAVALQRIGRAGHWRGAVPKGRIFATTRDELLECAALVRAIRQQDLDRLIVPEAPLDILAQQIVASCAAEEWDEDELFHTVRRAWPYRSLSREDFNSVLVMLDEGISARRGRFGSYLYRDQVNHRLRGRRGARLAAITSGGAIPETALFTVVSMPEGITVGTVDEDFATESIAGDIMLLGNTSWRIRRIETNSGRVLVEDAHGAPPDIPFWRGEAPSRTDELSLQVADLRHEISQRLPNTSPITIEQSPSSPFNSSSPFKSENSAIRKSGNQSSIVNQQSAISVRTLPSSPEVDDCRAWLMQECGLDSSAAEQMISYILEGRAVLGDVPTQQTIIAERFFDEGGGMQLIIHAPFGGRINKAWGLALRKRFCRSFNFELQAAATDNGLNIALAEQHSFPLSDVFHFLQTESVYDVLQQAVLTGSPIFATRWRWDANRSLALLRFQGGKKVPPQIQRMRSDDLLASVFPDVAACQENIQGDIQLPDHPLVREVMKDVMHEAMDIDGLRRVLDGIASGAIKTLSVDTPVPSQFSHEILNANPYAFLDDAPLEERRARAVTLRRLLPESVLQEVGRLDPVAIQQVQDEVRPDIRDADELHDLLQTLTVLPVPIALGGWELFHDKWQPYIDILLSTGRASVVHFGDRAYWTATERLSDFRVLFPGQELTAEPGALDQVLDRSLLGWLQHTGPITAPELSELLGLSESSVDASLLRLESTGSILRGTYRDYSLPTGKKVIEWCDRRLLARIHRLTLGVLRRQIEPVTPSQFVRWLLRWQHVAPGTQLSGERGLYEIIFQLQGFEISANAWERQIIARRVRDYDSARLDQLCLTGAVGWGRISPHPATLDDSGERTRRVVPTSVAPVTFFMRQECDWMQPRKHGEQSEQERGLSPVAREVLDFLRRRGASFFADIVRGTEKLKSEIETGLWELVAAGFVTADGFDNLRSLIDPKRRAGQGSARTARPRHAAGRWSLLYTGEDTVHTRMIEATCWMLLHRYGIVFRELLARETSVPRWRELQVAFRRFEDRGEIRGGRFIAGFIGEQFALPVAVESVREIKHVEPSGETITISAADPLNLVGILVPGERVPAISGRTVTFRDGVFIDRDDSHATPIREATL